MSELDGHEPERPYRERVAEYLRDVYGAGAVETNKYLPESGNFCDIWVDTPFIQLAIEVESRFKPYESLGQAYIYAQHHPDAVPVAVFPPGHVEEPEVEMMRQHLPVIELDV